MKTVNIAEIIAPDLGFRTQARDFRQYVDENFAGDSVTVDFNGVQFSSRAFMDEFFTLFLAPSVPSEKRIVVANLPDDIAAILSSVVRSNTQPVARPTSPALPPIMAASSSWTEAHLDEGK